MYLGIDLGTSGVKVLMMDEAQQIIASASSPVTVSRPHSGWSEQDPQEWIAATENAMDELKRGFAAPLSSVKGIGFSGQMHGATLLDKTGKVLRPCILWNDTRSHAEAAALDNNPLFRKISGNIVFPGFTAPKLVWVKNHEPEIFSQFAKVLLPKDYLRFWLTGDAVSEMSDAAGTSWFDTGARKWSPELLEASSMSLDQMPGLVEGNAPSGVLKDELANRWGMKRGVTIAGGAGDNAATAIGMGTVKSGSAFASLGTSGVLFAANDRYLPSPESAVHAFCHAVPDTWHQMGVILSATDSINWLASLTGKSAAELTSSLGDKLKAPSKVTFLPYLSGERTPHNDAKARGMLSGLDHASGSQCLAQAVVEGVAFALKDNMDALEKAGTRLDRVTAVGGGSRSKYWLEVISTVLNIPVDIPADGDFGAAFGAARLGLMAAEGLDPEAVCTPPEISRVIEPDETLVSAFAEVHEKYKQLYQATKELN
ncbi:MAG: xylulokinase [Salaquimonas sp.]